MKRYIRLLIVILSIHALTLDAQLEETHVLSDNFSLVQPEKKAPRLNAVYYEFLGNGLFFGSLNYERILPMSAHSYLAPHIGVGVYEWPFLVTELNLLLGGQKHFFETGIGHSTFAPEGGLGYISFRAGYRYMGPNGFVCRLAPEYLYDIAFWGGLTLGYSY